MTSDHYRHIALSGGTVEVEWIGPPPDLAPTIVFLHEGLGCISLWRDFPRELCRLTGWGGLVYSRYGYGGSSAVLLPRRLDYHAVEAESVLPVLLATLKVEKHLLLGHSDGGTIALLNAALASQPGLLGLVAAAPHVFVETMTITGIAEAKRRFDEPGERSLRARLMRYHGDNVDCAFRGWCDSWLHPDFRDWSVEAALPGVRVPALLVQGRGDEYASLEQIDRIATGVSGPVERLILENCGHSPHLERMDETLAGVAGFIARI